ncbi:MAG: ribose 5-phosphate isomerase B [Ignavibacteriaceae bacterium]
MKIAIAADHGGFELKNFLLKWLKENNYDVADLGSVVYDKEDDYPDFADKLAKYISSGSADRGIVICGSGVGACVSANKTKGIRASVCHDTYSAHQGVEHDDMNILCLGARIVGDELAKELVTAFLNAIFFNEGRFKRRLDKLTSLEK